MKSNTRHCLLCLTAISTFSFPAHAATTVATPSIAGNWDAVGTVKFSIKLPKTTLTGSINYGPNSLQLASGGILNPWSYEYYSFGSYGVPGTWSQTGKAYKFSYDLSKVNNTAIQKTVVVNGTGGMLQQFLALYLKKYKVTPTITDVSMKTYRETGTLAATDQLSGSSSTTLLLSYKDNANAAVTTATATLTLSYKAYRSTADSTCCDSAATAADTNLAASSVFMAANRKIKSNFSTKSGLQYRQFSAGAKGAKTPVDGDKVKVIYRGTLPNGKVFDENYSGVTFALNGVIPGFSEGLKLMKEGSYYRFFLPPDIAYGKNGAGSSIGPNSALIFDVVLQKINP